MRLRRRLLEAGAGLLAAAVIVAYGFDGGSLQIRMVRQAVGAALQILAPLVAALACAAAARAYAPGDRERAVWLTGAVAALTWAAGRAIYAGYLWRGGGILPFPSVADGFFVAFYLLLGAALAMEVRLVATMIERPVRLVLLGLGLAAWGVGFAVILAPVVRSHLPAAEKALAAFYPTAAVFLVPAGLVPALGFRGGTSAYPWLAVAGASGCLAAASFGYALLTRLDLYSGGHWINALWIVGFFLLALGAFWQRFLLEEV